jgi:integrase
VLLANTGIRPSEALLLRVEDCHLGRRPWIRVVRTKKLRPQFDDLEIPERIAECLRERIGEIHPSDPTTRLFAMNRRQPQRLFHYYARRAGIVRRVNLYMLRHTAATRLYALTRDIRLVQTILGHESADTTAIYAHVSPQIVRSVVESFPTTI